MIESVLPFGWQPPKKCLDDRVLRTTTNKWKACPFMSTVDWFEKNIRLPKKVSAFSGFYNRNNFPYQTGVLDAFDDIDVKEISLDWATQTGKSTLIQFLPSKIACTDPSPMMFACPDRPTAQEVSEQRIMSVASNIPELEKRLLPEARRNSMRPDLGDCIVYMAWSGSPASLGQKSCRYVFCTELSKWNRSKSDEADAGELVRERVKGFWNHKLVFEGTKTVEGICRINKLQINATQQLIYRCPCPNCGDYHEFNFDNVKWKKDSKGKTDREISEATAWFECQSCKAKIKDSQKMKMLRAGIWSENGVKIPHKFKGSVYYTPKKSKTRIHFHLESLASPVVSFSDMAGEFARCLKGEGKKTLQNFQNSWRALAFSVNIKCFKWEDIRDRLILKDAQRYIVPAWAKFLTGGVDIHKGWQVYTIRAWGFGGRSRLIDWGQTTDYSEIERKVITGNFIQDGAKLGMPVLLTGVDSGWSPFEVYQFVNRINKKYGERCRAIKGQSKGAPYWMNKLERSGADGQKIADGIELWNINDYYYKRFVLDRYDIPQGNEGCFELPIETKDDENYLRQICSEVLQEEENKFGQKIYKWVVIDVRVGNHYFDCEKIGAAMADMCGWDRIPPENAEVIAVDTVEKPKENNDFLGDPDEFWS